ncbi:nitrous oxide reductase family maturation protein NosD [uncultured Phenylobacterium sp.]|uniref:right-handed parallel beta-helix repeat-containing protein n=1 Tax=uncultured Phenylobacterium sp. TaxID=349273 RepID=UPI0025E2978E|nr:right-handed parallel beta-helix repeat-containing protein [uncultured Phenylobacterium sp.]
MRFIAPLLMALTTCACQAPAATIVATPETLLARVRSARPGDEVLLAAGSYPPLILRDVAKASPGSTIRPAEGAAAILSGLRFYGVSGVSVKDCRIESTIKFAIELRQTKDIAIKGCEIRGPTVAQRGLNDVWQGFYIKDSKNIDVVNNNIHDLRIAIGFGTVDDLNIEGNKIHDIASDGIRGAGTNIKIVRNTAWNLFKWNSDHIDFVQFATVANWTGGVTPAHIMIEDNEFRRRDGHQAQGIFMRGTPEVGYADVTIRGNGFVGANLNGIAVNFIDRVLVEDNFVQAEQGANLSTISVKESKEVAIRGNVASAERIVSVGNTPADPVGKNSLGLRRAPPGDYSALEAWRARRATGSRTSPRAHNSRD